MSEKLQNCALIYWIDSRTTSVVPMKKLPKTIQRVGAKAKLPWEDPITKVVSKYDVKVIALKGTSTRY